MLHCAAFKQRDNEICGQGAEAAQSVLSTRSFQTAY